MLPITVLVELGTVVAFGVLVDTFIVRSMLVPAIITVVGDKSWWPSALAREPRPPAAEAAAGRGPAEGARLASAPQVVVQIDDLRRRLAGAFGRLGLGPEDADALAGLLVDSELRGSATTASPRSGC